MTREIKEQIPFLIRQFGNKFVQHQQLIVKATDGVVTYLKTLFLIFFAKLLIPVSKIIVYFIVCAVVVNFF